MSWQLWESLHLHSQTPLGSHWDLGANSSLPSLLSLKTAKAHLRGQSPNKREAEEKSISPFMQELRTQRSHTRYTRFTCSFSLCPKTFDLLSPLTPMLKADNKGTLLLLCFPGFFHWSNFTVVESKSTHIEAESKQHQVSACLAVISPTGVAVPGTETCKPFPGSRSDTSLQLNFLTDWMGWKNIISLGKDGQRVMEMKLPKVSIKFRCLFSPRSVALLSSTWVSYFRLLKPVQAGIIHKLTEEKKETLLKVISPTYPGCIVPVPHTTHQSRLPDIAGSGFAQKWKRGLCLSFTWHFVHCWFKGLLSSAPQVKLLCEARSEADDYSAGEMVSAVSCSHSITFKAGWIQIDFRFNVCSWRKPT